MEQQRNWAGNYTYGTTEIHIPESLEQVQELVAASDRLKVLGTRHSFNGIADSQDRFVSLQKLNRVIGLDRENRQVTVEGGIRYGELCQYLDAQGYAIHNVASLPHITVSGACATATHGSGVRNGNLATAVSALEIVTASGETVTFSRDRPDRPVEGAIVNLGGLGVVAKVTLDIVPAFRMRQYVYENLPFASLEDHLDEIMSRAYSVSLFTDWKDDSINQVWVKEALSDSSAADPGSELYGAKLASGRCHPVPGQTPEYCTEQLGIPGPWHERMPHFRMEFTPSAGEELQSEYFISRKDAYPALCAINQIRDRISPLLHISEIRTIAADELWMSPCYRQDCVAIHLTWKDDWESVRAVLPEIERVLEPFDAAPHWGKLFTMAPARVRSLYERLPDFRRLLERHDPTGKFRNAYLDTYIFNAK